MPSMRGDSVTVAVMTVESLKGEILSPKKAPTQTAPAAASSGTPRPSATPMQATPTVASVPQEVPPKVLMSVQRTQATGRKSAGVIIFMPHQIMTGMVPAPIQMPMSTPTASRMSIATSIEAIVSLMPF